jgi:predicted N-acyltransferase
VYRTLSESQQLEVHFLTAVEQIPAAQWNAITGTDYPFLRHEFLSCLEQTGCTDGESGWQPCHATLYRGEKLIAVMPLYLKSHSWGEYVFDWGWADAWQRQGLKYYPKLVTAIPFTPATGPRLCLAEDEAREAIFPMMFQAVKQLAEQEGASSWHLLFPRADEASVLKENGSSIRMGSQFHWFNRDYSNFDDFLQRFNSRKRKSLRRERRRVEEQGIELQVLEAAEITPAHWEKFYFFYQLTYAKRSGHGGYLSREFFMRLADTMADACVMVMAQHEGKAVGGALYFRSSDTLYGRYWGCEQELDCLHFEACYYQGIEYCIRHGLQRFDPGAQGEHKIQRGFEPIKTWSSHWIADSGFAAAIEDFTQRESLETQRYIEQASSYLPFRVEP